MLDIQLLRKDLPAVAARIAERGGTIDWDQFTALEKSRKEIQTIVQDTQAAQNKLSKEIGQAKGKGQDVAELMQAAERYKETLASSEKRRAPSSLLRKNSWRIDTCPVCRAPEMLVVPWSLSSCSPRAVTGLDE